MVAFRTGTVTAIRDERAGIQRVEVDGERAYVLTDLVGPVAVGDEVVVNVTAVELGLGTGGWHVVHWNLARREWRAPGRGHVMKLRYSSLQVDTGVIEELDASVAEADDLLGLPVVVAALHSQLPCIAATFAQAAPERRLVYVMTDSAALPMALSDTVAELRQQGLLAASITAGQAFGGDHEAVNVASALVAARHALAADAVVVAPGPGVVGTATRLGFSALEVGPVLDAVELLGGRPICALRGSSGDDRPRHQGVSHHSITTLRLATRARATLPVPAGEHEVVVRARLEGEGIADRHRVLRVEEVDVAGLLSGLGMAVTTMGRSAAEDPLFFALAGAAGTAAAGMVR